MAEVGRVGIRRGGGGVMAEVGRVGIRREGGGTCNGRSRERGDQEGRGGRCEGVRWRNWDGREVW